MKGCPQPDVPNRARRAGHTEPGAPTKAREPRRVVRRARKRGRRRRAHPDPGRRARSRPAPRPGLPAGRHSQHADPTPHRIRGAHHGHAHHLALHAERPAGGREPHGRRDGLGNGGDHVGVGHPGADRRLRRRPAGQGRDRRRGDGPRPHHVRARDPAHGRRAGGRHRRHRRRPGAHRQRLDHGRHRRGGGRGPGRQARQPGGLLAVRRGRRARTPGRRPRPVAGDHRQGRRGGRHRLLLRARLPPGAALHRPAAQGDRRADGVQLPRAAGQPARPAAQAIGVFDARMLPVMAGVFAERGVSALVFRGDDGLDELSTAAPSTVFVVRDGTATQTTIDPADLGIPVPSRATCAAATSSSTRRRCATCCAARRGRCATRCC